MKIIILFFLCFILTNSISFSQDCEITKVLIEHWQKKVKNYIEVDTTFNYEDSIIIYQDIPGFKKVYGNYVVDYYILTNKMTFEKEHIFFDHDFKKYSNKKLFVDTSYKISDCQDFGKTKVVYLDDPKIFFEEFNENRIDTLNNEIVTHFSTLMSFSNALYFSNKALICVKQFDDLQGHYGISTYLLKKKLSGKWKIKKNTYFRT